VKGINEESDLELVTFYLDRERLERERERDLELARRNLEREVSDWPPLPPIHPVVLLPFSPFNASSLYPTSPSLSLLFSFSL
jgi:hypothetical protein